MGKRATILFRKPLPKEEKASLRAFAQSLVTEVLEDRNFTCLITGDKQLQELNRDFLQHDYPTDVLSFPSGDPEDLGELAISLDRATAQAAEHQHTTLEELKVLMLHGVLHLSGLDHETDKGQMRRIETKWRKSLGLPGGLIERSRK
ncbi:rRNA maturation RNase YbeY [Bryobacter aggregatus]|uniref:rRNA maturation RNase YbeY n=1 Tax=Bryobacter aggregatus TaxID=360054 RepID=UPI0004E273C1|nr:rRNA maturation RNase YbeY [Bryobacter aggregatus]